MAVVMVTKIRHFRDQQYCHIMSAPDEGISSSLSGTHSPADISHSNYHHRIRESSTEALSMMLHFARHDS